METKENKEGFAKPTSENKEVTITPLFDEEGNLVEPDTGVYMKQDVVAVDPETEKTEEINIESASDEIHEVTKVPAEISDEIPENDSEPRIKAEVGIKDEDETEVEVESPKAIEAETPEVVEAETPEAVEPEVEVEVEVELPEAIEAETPEIVEAEALEAKETEVEVESPEPIEVETPEVVETETPEESVTAELSDSIETISPDGESDADSEELEEIEDHADYTSLSKEEIVTAMEELVAHEKVMLFRQKAGKLKIAFFELIKAEKEQALNFFVAEGGLQSDFAYTPDELSQRFEAALHLYKEKKQQHLEKLEEVKKENMVRKLEMLEKIKELINSEEPLKKTYDEFRSIQDKWREIGNVPKNEIGNLWQSYHFLVEKFFDKVKINNELRDLDMKKNLEKKIELCEKAEELLLETSVIKSFKQLQRYHQEWKEIGAVHHDKKDELWERFKDTTEKINERRREYYEQLHSEQENNYSAKKALCEKASEIVANLPESISDWQKYNEEVNELIKMWRSLGPAPRQYNDEVWKRFKSLVDEFYNQKKIHFTSVKDEQINNYNMKLDICQQAEALKESTEWRETTEDLIRLQQEWKKIGPVPRRHADKIWKRFRTACDYFFEQKQKHFSTQKESEEENLKIKEGLIEKIRQLEISDKKEEALNTIKDIQREFIETGHVPFRRKNEIHTAFREAINQKLDLLKISYSEINAGTFRPRGDSRFERGDRQSRIPARENMSLQNKISKLKNDIALWENNIGFLANSAAAEVLKIEFEKKIERTKEEIILLETKLKMLQE